MMRRGNVEMIDVVLDSHMVILYPLCMLHLSGQGPFKAHLFMVYYGGFFGLFSIHFMALHVHILLVYVHWFKPISMASQLPLDSIHP